MRVRGKDLFGGLGGFLLGHEPVSFVFHRRFRS